MKSADLKNENMVLLGTGHCFRDQVLRVSPELGRFAAGDGLQKTFEGSSLETVRQMVASGVGITILPATSVPARVARDSLLAYVPFARPVPDRRVVLVHRKSFPRKPAIAALRTAIRDSDLPGAQKLDMPAA